MAVRHVGKQMMFDLVVEAAGKPGDEPRRRGEVGGRSELVDRPIIPNPDSSKLHPRRQMRNLKDDREQPAEDEMEDNKRGYCPRQRQDEEGRKDDQ